MLYFWTFYSLKESWKNCITVFTKNIKQLFSTLIIRTIINIWAPIKTDNNWAAKRMISEDHVTLKTGVMMLKIQLYITEINYIFKIYSNKMLF